MRVTTTAKRLKELADYYDISQSDMVEKTGIPKSSMSLYWNGKREPRQNILTKIALKYDVSETWLLGYDVPMRREAIEWNPETQDIYITEPENTVMEKYNDTLGSKDISKYFDFLSAFTSLSEKDQQMIADMVNRLSNKN